MSINFIKGIPSTSNKQLPNLIFIHGAWHGAWCWQDFFLPYFSKHGYSCYAFDLPKHGKTKDEPGINHYRIADYVVTLKKVISEIDSPSVLIGHSMGGYIVQQFLEKNDCLGAALLSPVPGNHCWPLFYKLLKKMPYSVLKMMFGFDLIQLVNTPEKAGDLLYSPTMPKEKVAFYTNKLGNESFKLMIFDFLFRRIRKKQNASIPVLVQCAGKDQIVSLKENKTTARFQNATFQFYPKLAHNIMLEENWEQAAKGLLDWLKTHFSIKEIQSTPAIKNPSLNTIFPDAVQDIITTLGENKEIDANKSEILGLGKSKRNN